VDVLEGSCGTWTLSAALGLNDHVNTALAMGLGSFGPGDTGSQWTFAFSWTVPAVEAFQTAHVVCSLSNLIMIQAGGSWSC